MNASTREIVVGLSGPTGAGKTTAGHILERMGYSYHRFSHILERLLRDRGMEATREALQRLGAEVHSNPGQEWLCEQLAADIPQAGNAVIDGLRYIEDHGFFTRRYGSGFLHISIDTPPGIRRARAIERGDSEGALQMAFSRDAESAAPHLLRLAHRVVRNDGDIDQLETMLLQAISDHGRHSERCP